MVNEHYMEMGEDNPQRPRMPDTAQLEAVIREQHTDIIEGITHQDQLRADAINAVLRAKGVTNLMTPYEAAKVFTILSHLEELAGYSG